MAPLRLDRITDRFRSSIADIKAYSTLSDKDDIDCNTKENLYRSQIVMTVSAFDSFLHELSKVVTLYMFNNQWTRKTKAFEDLVNELKKLGRMITQEALVTKMHEMIKSKSFYNYRSKSDEGIDYCLFHLIGLDEQAIALNSQLWSGATPTFVFSSRIREIAARRNTIAHNYDRDDSSLNRTGIDKGYTSKIVSDINKIVEGIIKEVERNIVKIS